MMKKLLCMLLALASLCSFALADEPTITVNASATVTLPADRAVISIGVRTSAATAAEASEQNAAAINALIPALEAVGVLPEDITTAEYSIYPDYTYNDDGSRTLVGYEVNNMLSVAVRDVEQVGTVLDAAIAAGANEMYGITFASTQQQAGQDQALSAAIEEAQRKGLLMAEATGMTLGPIVTITEGGGNYAVYANAKLETADMAAGATTIIADGVDVTATVTVTFVLLPESEG